MRADLGRGDRLTSCVTLLVLLLGALLCVVLVPHFGLLGAASSMVVANLSRAAILAVVARRVLDLSVGRESAR